MQINISNIKKLVADYFKDKPVSAIYLFGSIAKNTAHQNSDVDLLADFTTPISLIKKYQYQNDLALLLKRPVDILTKKGLEKAGLYSTIQNDLIQLYESAR